MTVILWGCVESKEGKAGAAWGWTEGPGQVGASASLLQRFMRPTPNLTSSFPRGAASLFSSEEELSIRSES